MIFHGIEIDESKLTRNYLEQPLKRGENPSKEEVQYLYLDCNLTMNLLDEFMGKCMTKYCQRHGIKKPDHLRVQSIKKTNIERYGNPSSLHGSNQEKLLQIFQSKYGCSNPGVSKEVREKIQRTNLEKYGTLWSTQSEKVQKKIAESNLEKYGCGNPFGSREIQEKIKQTNLERYGCSNVAKSEEIKRKIQETNLKKYGVPNASSCLWLRHGTEIAEILESTDKLQKLIEECEGSPWKVAEQLGLSKLTLYSHCKKHGLMKFFNQGLSKPEHEITKLFPNTFIKTRSIIPPYEIDLYSEEHKFGIEFNGNYWHSDKCIDDSFYHQKKSLLAEEKGIFLYHIWEYEWLDPLKKEIIVAQIKNLLKRTENKVHARKCCLATPSSKEAGIFLVENHIQGWCQSSVQIGLYYDNELVSLMTFGKPRFKSECQWELLRFCNKKNYAIVGGASKLFKHFIEKHKPKSILSYSRIDKGRGNLYEKLGFCLVSISSPDYVWVSKEEVLSRYQCQKHKLLKQGFDGTSEKEIMESRGFSRMNGCGNKIWLWKAQNSSFR